MDIRFSGGVEAEKRVLAQMHREQSGGNGGLRGPSDSVRDFIIIGGVQLG